MSRYRPFADVMAGRIEDHPDKAAVEAGRFREEQAIRKADELGMAAQFEADKARGRAFTKYDAEKTRFDLIPPKFLAGMARVLTIGAAKYSPRNWEKCATPFETYYAALQRHLNAYAQGELLDPETGESHLYHAACCIAFLSELT